MAGSFHVPRLQICILECQYHVIATTRCPQPRQSLWPSFRRARGCTRSSPRPRRSACPLPCRRRVQVGVGCWSRGRAAAKPTPPPPPPPSQSRTHRAWHIVTNRRSEHFLEVARAQIGRGRRQQRLRAGPRLRSPRTPRQTAWQAPSAPRRRPRPPQHRSSAPPAGTRTPTMHALVERH